MRFSIHLPPPARFAMSAAGAVALLISCGGTAPPAEPEQPVDEPVEDTGVDDTGTAPLDSGGDTAVFDVGDTAPPPPVCPPDTQKIFVVTLQNDLYKFDPNPKKLTMTLVGKLSCPAGGSTPFSMAVDRKGTAWVLFSPSGDIFNVSTKDAKCKATAYVPDQMTTGGVFHTFGMGFVSNSSGSVDETLYVAHYGGAGLGKIDSKLKLTFVGDYGSALGAGELTGTGTARIFGFFNLSPVKVAELNKKTGKSIKEKSVSGVSVGSGWAFAHWGGSFYLFTAPSGSSQIDKFDFDKGTSSTIKSGLGYVIVGAGVSTCAPTKPPPLG